MKLKEYLLTEARKLSTKQKKLLDTVDKGIMSYDDIPNDIRSQLERLNDYETMWSDAQRYLWDRK